MRLFWAGFLMTGLFLIGLGVYDQQQDAGEPGAGGGMARASEDGTPMPQPYPTPTPRPKQ